MLRDGPLSPYARWFDVDWSVTDHAILMPVLGSRIGQVLDAGEPVAGARRRRRRRRAWCCATTTTSSRCGPAPRTCRWPSSSTASGTGWRTGGSPTRSLNYRRFFDVDTLAAVRVEDPEVFEATHRLLLDLVADGSLDGLRIDHPDGLADPRGYLDRLADATNGSWVVVEKILEGHEQRPPTGAAPAPPATTPSGGSAASSSTPPAAARCRRCSPSLTGDGDGIDTVVEQAEREVVAQGQYAEVHRLVDLLVEICRSDVHLRDHTQRALQDAVTEPAGRDGPVPRLRGAGRAGAAGVGRGARRRGRPRASAPARARARHARRRPRPGARARPRLGVGALGRLERGGPADGGARARRAWSSGSSRPAVRSWPRASRTPPSTAGSGSPG
ncbi:hypothetical protein GCM10025868_04750 [Angustibacter aerolatus]|uniref:Glycosyl hydrolase family 13 catalytic domain-containing protein n=1 Tax=Angustibacter aerolatus TaxID=1162965 RepID=A0ABQ6JEH3_9ACTN|nr:hypothetical protein [Angustibacter aerolatus]GMA85225.1 hypothetical protein GCM10025868_04750 [Angustibacter aerolatus]